jgi:DNA-directed RNA polymerase specialized sigma24 family protein
VAQDAELLEAVYGYARRRVADRTSAEALTVTVLRQAGLGNGSSVDRAGAFRAIAEAVRGTEDAALRDPDSLAIELFALALEPELRDGFERLDLERRRVLTLHYLDRLGPAEMAAVLGTRAVAVQSRLAASLRELRRGDPARDEAISAA